MICICFAIRHEVSIIRNMVSPRFYPPFISQLLQSLDSPEQKTDDDDGEHLRQVLPHEVAAVRRVQLVGPKEGDGEDEALPHLLVL